MKSLSVHLDRLEKVLKARGIPCKRHQTLEVAAAAFGYHNQNELTAAGKAGDLNPPLAEPIGEVALPTGETIIVVRDPLANSAYAVDQAFVEQVIAEERAELFGPTPYGHLLNLSRLLDDQILPLQANLDGIGASETIEIPLFIGQVSHKHGDNLYVMATQEALDAEVADYCRSSLFNDRTFRPGNPADDGEDLTKLSDKDIIRWYFDAPHEEYLHTSTDTLRVPLPLLRELLGVMPSAASQPKRNTGPSAKPEPKPLPDTTHPSARQLIAGIDSVWDDHPDYPSEDWKYEVENGDTRRGYWDWVAAKLEEAEDEDDEAEDTADTADLPPVQKWCADDADGYAGGLLYTTNGCCEVAHAGPRLFSKLGLEWSVDEHGFFYPLTEKESRFIGEDGIELPNGFWPHMAYSCLYEGRKFAYPSIEIGYGRDNEGDRETVLRQLKAYADQIRPRIEAIGGHVILEEDDPDTSHTLLTLIPFDYIVQNAVEFDDWKIKLARLMMPKDAPAVMAEFTPQVWVGDQTMVVDPQGDTTWDITAEIIAMGRQKALELQDDQHNTDDLRYTFNAPKWVQDWEGPFYMEVSEQIAAFYEALDKKA
ncbi:hypothetical protein [Microvirga sp. VF16]|uniref:hypothetical protein n=1 Tax=Microvirga sp. VF16 TaxID=2807101 RepID=UPI00193DA902|nr:hypothetical protein [Microvirga sp. VF16]QRM34823.1 hypothetical protein JO965_41930 [Microvirga sp. VF16]